MSQSHKKPVALALGTALIGGLALSGSAFAVTPLAQGYMAGAQAAEPAPDKTKEGSCGANKASAEGKCGEGKCGMERMDTNKDGMVSAAEHEAAARAMFGKADANNDGMISADEMKAMREGKCGDSKMGGKASTEGKCGEGKCGGGMKADGK